MSNPGSSSTLARTQFGAEINRTYGERQMGTDTFGFTGGKMNATKGRIQKRRNELGGTASLQNLTSGAPYIHRGPVTQILGQAFMTRYTSPGFDDHIALKEQQTNTKFVINRRARKISDKYAAVDVNDLAFLYLNGKESLNTTRLRGTETTVQVNALPLLNPETLNLILRQQQVAMNEHEPDRYKDLTPSDIFKDYILDGIPESAWSMSEGGTDCGDKLITMAIKGMTNVNDYWPPNKKTGSVLYFMISKFAQPSTEFNIGTLRALNGQSGFTQVDTVSPIKPYQVGFFSMPNGGPVPVEQTRYVDEWDRHRTDSLVVKVGTVFSVPPEHVYKDVNTRAVAFTGVASGTHDTGFLGDRGTHLFDQTGANNTGFLRIILNCKNATSPLC